MREPNRWRCWGACIVLRAFLHVGDRGRPKKCGVQLLSRPDIDAGEVMMTVYR